MQALTCSRARQIASQLTEVPSEAVAEREEAHSLEPPITEEKENSVTAEAPLKMIPVENSRSKVKSSVEVTEREISSVFSPPSGGFDRESLHVGALTSPPGGQGVAQRGATEGPDSDTFTLQRERGHS